MDATKKISTTVVIVAIIIDCRLNVKQYSAGIVRELFAGRSIKIMVLENRHIPWERIISAVIPYQVVVCRT